jgi:N6-adenosine-specific RNA methylase IME4
MSLSEIAELPIEKMAAGDSMLWLWTTNRWLPHAFSVVESWGFSYRQTLVWAKNNPMPLGTAVAPSAAEFLLACKRGKPRINRVFPSSVLMTSRPPARRHSTKPDVFQDYIEATSPGPYLELFARRNRLGWDTWGNEALEHVEMSQ